MLGTLPAGVHTIFKEKSSARFHGFPRGAQFMVVLSGQRNSPNYRAAVLQPFNYENMLTQLVDQQQAHQRTLFQEMVTKVPIWSRVAGTQSPHKRSCLSLRDGHSLSKHR